MDNRLELLLLVFLSLPCGSWRVLLSKAHPFLQVRVGDVEHLQVGVHRFLHHLLERLLLLLGLLLEGLLLLLGLLHHLLGVVLLLLDLLGELLHLAKPFPGTFRCLHSPVCGLAHRLLHPRLFRYIVVRTRFSLTGIRWRFVNRYGGATSLHPPFFDLRRSPLRRSSLRRPPGRQRPRTRWS